MCLVHSRKYGTCLVANPEVFGRSFPQTHMSCGHLSPNTSDRCLVDLNGHMYGGSWFRSLYGQMSCGHAPIHPLGHMCRGNDGTSWTHVRWVLVV